MAHAAKKKIGNTERADAVSLSRPRRFIAGVLPEANDRKAAVIGVDFQVMMQAVENAWKGGKGKTVDTGLD